MKIAILGASAGVGLLCVQQALARGHEVTTLSRDTDSLPQHSQLTAIKGSATNLPDLRRALDGAQAVLVTLGTGTSTKATTLYTDAARALIAVQKESGSQAPFIVLTGFGAGNSAAYQGFVTRLLFKLLLADIYKNKSDMERLIAASALRWMCVRPGRLTNKPRTERYRVETEYRPGMNIGAIGRADVADYMVKQAESPTALGKYPALCNH